MSERWHIPGYASIFPSKQAALDAIAQAKHDSQAYWLSDPAKSYLAGIAKSTPVKMADTDSRA